MATTRLNYYSFPSPSVSLPNKTKTPSATLQTSTPNFLYPKLHYCRWTSNNTSNSSSSQGRDCYAMFAVVNEETVVAEDKTDKNEDSEGEVDLNTQPVPCELYVCNLPRSFDIAKLVEMFQPFGSIVSAEVSCNPETGVSRGCGFVTMSTVNSARTAISALDGSDVDGREVRVRYSVEMSSGLRNPEVLNSAPTKVLMYESPHKLYVGNLAWNTKPEELRNHFSQFGTVVSARMLYDRKGGRSRAYGFLSFSSAAERNAALSLNETELRGRVIVVRKGVKKGTRVDKNISV